MPDRAAKRVVVAQIGAPHGVRGEVRLRIFTEDAEALSAYGPLENEAGAPVTVSRLRPAKNGFVAAVEGVETREAAARLTNARLYVQRDRLPEADDDEWYHVDLIGLAAFHVDGRPLGRVVAVQDFGAGDLLEIRLEDAPRTVFVPFTKEIVPVVDLAAGRIEIAPPEDLLG